MPRRDEEMLKDVPKKVEAMIEECVKGLPTLGHVIRRWLRSAKASEPDVRPMARLQNEDSQKRYSGYMTRFVCYTLRVWKSCEDAGIADFRDEGANMGGEEDEDVDEDGHETEDEVDNSIEDATAFIPTSEPADSGISEVDTMKDARRLYP